MSKMQAPHLKGQAGAYGNEIKCHECKQPGHKWRQCPKLSGNGSQGYKKKKGKGGKGKKGAQGPPDETTLLLAAEKDPEPDSVVLATPKEKFGFQADTGASYHVINDREMLSDYREARNSAYGSVGGKVKAQGFGTLRCKAWNGSEWSIVNLQNVSYIPGQPYNLISIGQLAENIGVKVEFDKDNMILTRNGEPLMTGKKNVDFKNLYHVYIRPIDQQTQVLATCSSLSIWHERFCHVNERKLIDMIKKESVIGLPSQVEQSVGQCIPCIQGKLTDVPHKPAETSARLPGQVIHADIGGYTSRSINGNEYYLICKDVLSKYRKIYFMRDRTQVLEKLKLLYNDVKRETGNEILKFRSDQGTEFKSAEVATFFKSKGIRHEFAEVATPQQVGGPERENRTIDEHVTTILLDAGLSHNFWDEAANTVCYTMNRVSLANGVTPYALWHGKKPNVSHFRIFGSTGYALKKKGRKKFLDKTYKVIFTGYTESDTVYRCYNLSNKKMELHSSVRFVENPRSRRQVEFSLRDDVDLAESSAGDEDEHRGPGRPLGSKNKIYERDEARVQSLRSSGQEEILGALPEVIASVAAGDEPQNYREAVESEEIEKWNVAMEEEIQAIKRNDTWTLVPRPPNKNVISVKWVYKIKADGRYKARLVARGFTQKYMEDFFATYSPVARTESIRLLLSLAASLDLEMTQFDISTAFLNGDLKEEIYVEQPHGFTDGTRKVCRLKKGLYGLKQAPRAWNQKFNDVARVVGFETSLLDPCLYHMKSERGLALMCLHVDDGLLCASNQSLINEIIGEFSRHFEVKSIPSKNYLGFQYRRIRSERKIVVNMGDYIEKKLKQFEMTDAKPVGSPMEPKVNLYDEADLDVNYPYRQAVGSLLYLAVKTRPDISFAVSTLSRFVSKPTVIHVEAVKRVFRYLAGTSGLSITFGGMEDLCAFGYSDADFGGDLTGRYSTTGYLVHLNGPVCWSSKLQTCVAESTCEAEYVAASQCSRDIRFLVNLLKTIELHIANLPIQLFCDNQAAVSAVNGDCVSYKLRHIDIRYHSIRELKDVIVTWISTKYQLTDVFTKALGPGRHRFLIELI